MKIKSFTPSQPPPASRGRSMKARAPSPACRGGLGWGCSLHEDQKLHPLPTSPCEQGEEHEGPRPLPCCRGRSMKSCAPSPACRGGLGWGRSLHEDQKRHPLPLLHEDQKRHPLPTSSRGRSMKARAPSPACRGGLGWGRSSLGNRGLHTTSKSLIFPADQLAGKLPAG